MVNTTKSKDRVRGYKEGTKDWEAAYNMLLDDGVMCDDCLYFNRCQTFGFTWPGRTECDFYPNRFNPNKP